MTRAAASVLCVLGSLAAARGDEPEARALAFLAREVPRWAVENRCHSCHHDGDAARALFEARRLGRALGTPDPTAATAAWLARPEGWDRNGGDGPFSDKPLARVQFTSALAAAVASGAVPDRAPLLRAADRLAADQQDDGSWPVATTADSLGSPAGYGRPLATLAAREALQATDPAAHRKAIERADRWLRARPVANVPDAAVALLAISAARGEDPDRRRGALATLRAGRSSDGGWGPYVDAPPEPFDTALVLLALVRLGPDDTTRPWVERARAYLIASQSDDGGWPETTRPAGAESQAQRLSTSAWATLALLATRPAVTAGPRTAR